MKKGGINMASAVFQMRIDEDLKNKASNLYNKIGLDLPTAIRMFLKKSIIEQGIPFDTKIVSENKGINILNTINKQSEQNKNSNMTIEEINQEIKNYRESL